MRPDKKFTKAWCVFTSQLIDEQCRRPKEYKIKGIKGKSILHKDGSLTPIAGSWYCFYFSIEDALDATQEHYQRVVEKARYKLKDATNNLKNFKQYRRVSANDNP